jgi:5-formyltetrahydrofolate cyclo-ligase
MDEIQATKMEIREEITATLAGLAAEKFEEIREETQGRLFEFANFLEAKIALLYVNSPGEVDTGGIIQAAYEYGKIVVLPAFDMEKHQVSLMKVNNPKTDLIMGPRGVAEPDPARCKKVPIDCIDIAIIPGIAFDEKGGRIGQGMGFYDRLIPDLPVTTRKVALAFECQIIPQVPIESHDKYVDIIITENRVIYKI